MDFPSNFKSLPSAPEGVLAEGEHTAHAHQLFYNHAPMKPAWQPEVIEGGKEQQVGKFTLRQVSPQEMYLLIEGDSMLLKHQEHRPMRLPPGRYEIGIQQEYDPFEQLRRQVLD